MVIMMAILRDHFLETHWDILMVKCLALYLEMRMESHLGLMLDQRWAIYMNPLVIFTGFFGGQNLVDYIYFCVRSLFYLCWISLFKYWYRCNFSKELRSDVILTSFSCRVSLQ